MKTAFLLFASLALCMVARAESPDSIPNPRQKNHSSIYDGAKVINSADKRRIDDAANALEKKTGAQLMVVTVQTLDGMSIEDWSNDVFRRIGVGHKGKDDGAMFVFAIRDRKSRLEVGPDLQDRLTDARATAILRDQVRPAFRENNYGQGIVDGVNVAANYIDGGKRSVSSSSGSSGTSGSSGSGSTSSSSPGGTSSGSTGFSSSPRSSSGGSGGSILLLLGVLVVGGGGAIAYVATRPRKCPRCGATMTKADTPESELEDAQKLEQRLGSRTFTKFTCPKCAFSDVEAKDVTFSNFTLCQQCGNRTARVKRKTLSSATYDFEGEEEVTETCEYPPCRHRNRHTRTLPRLVRSTSSSSIGSSSSSSSSSSGSSYDGGSSSSYGGGSSDGGGGSSSW